LVDRFAILVFRFAIASHGERETVNLVRETVNLVRETVNLDRDFQEFLFYDARRPRILPQASRGRVADQR
jgi:hypothetical protein